MKKMIALVGALVMATVAVQAVSVDWSVNIGKANGGKLLYVFDSTKMTDVETALKTLQGDDLSSALSGLAATTPTTLNTKAGKATGDVTTATDAEMPANLSFVIIDSTASGAEYKITGTMSTAGLTYSGTQTPAGKVDITDIAQFTKSGTVCPVPEPTTVALVALGLAALGLKRKVA